MKWFILVVGIVVLCFVVALVLGLAGGGLGRGTTSLSHEPLPDEPIRDADFDDLVFDVGARGYRMSQVDGVVDRLRRELREKDAEIAVLRGDEAAVASDEAADPAEPVEPGEPLGQSDPTVGRERTT
ncbi:cell division protein DivIVA [Terrabacter sp. 2YAF2]|uniref:cell division protein DivIVA n=1 Tax=Terrabacter sp. 2YAF2 TaxID=3233026 RepID=UPI003F988764